MFKRDYYRNEDDNPGISLSATAAAMAEADAAVAGTLGAPAAGVGGGGSAGGGSAGGGGAAGFLSAGTANVVKGAALMVAAAGLVVIGDHYMKQQPTEYQPILS